MHGGGDTKGKRLSLASTARLSSGGTCAPLDNFTGLEVLGVVGTGGKEAVVNLEVFDSAFRRIHVESVANIAGHKGSESHFVLGECSSLVRADNRHTTKGFDGGQGADNSVILSHVRNSPGVSHGDNGFQTFGNHGNGTDKGSRKCVEAIQVGNEKGHKPSSKSSDGNKDGQPSRDGINLLENVSLLLFDLVDESIDCTNFSKITSGNDNTSTGTLRDQSGGKAHVMTITERDRGWFLSLGINGVSSLVNRDRLSRQSSLECRQVGDFTHAQISRYAITQGKFDNVTWDELGGVDLDILAVTNDEGFRRQHVLERFGSCLG
mmetsp:Transcript_19665/g.37237  ORF Transcript_19665/g.37237 Transcript_19665/m.37237 type:complete len:321 (+) Transcript_19665:1974-2936(+)